MCNVYNGKKNGIVKNLKSSIFKKKKLFVTNSMAFRNYINVRDLVIIITKMLNTKLKYKVYNLGYENIKLIDLINKLEKKFKFQINYIDRKMKLDKIPSQKISCSRVFNEIKYRPKIKIKNYLVKKFKMNYKFLKNKSILITGGTGSIGSALVKYLVKTNCKVIRVMSNDENGLYNLSRDLNLTSFSFDNFSEEMKLNKIRFFLGDVRDFHRCKEVTKNVDIVIHAAALKHVS